MKYADVKILNETCFVLTRLSSKQILSLYKIDLRTENTRPTHGDDQRFVISGGAKIFHRRYMRTMG